MVIKDKILLLFFSSNHGVYVVFKVLEVIFYYVICVIIMEMIHCEGGNYFPVGKYHAFHRLRC